MMVARNPASALFSRLMGLARPVFVGLMILLGLGMVGLPPTSLSAAATAPQAGFLSNLDDIPLMPGLAERKDLAVSFDKPEGRIVEAYAEGSLTPAAVSKFYASTLPQLGWRSQGNNRFAREGEELILNFTTAAKKLTVQFSLSPKS